MKYICLVYNDESRIATIPDEELDRLTVGCMVHVAELQSAGHHVASSALESTRSATTIRHQNGEVTVTDGPFAETKEVLGGFTIIEARDLNEAIQIASKFPTGQLGCIEVRPLLDPTAELTNPIDRKLAASVMRGVQSTGNCWPDPEVISS